MPLTRRIAVFLCMLVLAATAGAGTPVVRLVGPAVIVAEVRQRLVDRHVEAELHSDAAPAQLVVAVGARAFRDALANSDGTPVVGIALTRESYRTAVRDVAHASRQHHTAVYWEPDPVRQLQLAKLLLPSARTVGLVPGAQTDETLLAALRAECARLGLTPVVNAPDAKNESSLPHRLAVLLPEADFLLGIDSADVFSTDNAKTILLTAYRHGRPVIGPAAAWVDAGSIASLSSGLPEAVDTLAAWLPRLLAAGDLPPPRYPDRYTVATNPQVARSLSLTLPTAERIDAFLRGPGGTP